MAIDTSDFRNGMALYLNNEVFTILEFQHVKPGKGGAFVRTKLRKIPGGSVIEKTFRAGEKVDPAYLEKKPMQYLYRQGNEVVLMDLDTYEQASVDFDVIKSELKFMKEEMELTALLVDSKVVAYEAPKIVELIVSQTDPGYKGDTVSGSSTKSAMLETGASIQVPYHINEGDTIKIDTRDEVYLERVKK